MRTRWDGALKTRWQISPVSDSSENDESGNSIINTWIYFWINSFGFLWCDDSRLQRKIHLETGATISSIRWKPNAYSRYCSVSMDCELWISNKIGTMTLTLRHSCNIFVGGVKIEHFKILNAYLIILFYFRLALSFELHTHVNHGIWPRANNAIEKSQTILDRIFLLLQSMPSLSLSDSLNAIQLFAGIFFFFSEKNNSINYITDR